MNIFSFNGIYINVSEWVFECYLLGCCDLEAGCAVCVADSFTDGWRLTDSLVTLCFALYVHFNIYSSNILNLLFSS